MNNLSIGDLAAITGGRLRLGVLPPIGGRQEPVGRIVLDSRAVEPGDVFWALSGSRQDGSRFAEEAFCRGALGVVVSGRKIEPWAGRFALEVEDSQSAWRHLVSWVHWQLRTDELPVT